MSICKGCLTAEIKEPEVPANFRPGQGRWVTENEFQRRLDICYICQDYVAGSTCNQCGCLVNYRAALKDKTCPHPDGNKWG